MRPSATWPRQSGGCYCEGQRRASPGARGQRGERGSADNVAKGSLHENFHHARNAVIDVRFAQLTWWCADPGGAAAVPLVALPDLCRNRCQISRGGRRLSQKGLGAATRQPPALPLFCRGSRSRAFSCRISPRRSIGRTPAIATLVVTLVLHARQLPSTTAEQAAQIPPNEVPPAPVRQHMAGG